MKNYRKDFRVYLADLARRRPSPGGGSAVCLIFCLGISLMEKSINYSIMLKPKTPKDKNCNKRLKGQLLRLQKLSKKVYPCIDKDSYLFNKIMKAKGKKRLEVVRESEKLILELARACTKVFSLAKGIESGIKNSIISDFNIGLESLRVSLLGCVFNLEANSVLFGKENKNIGTLKKVLKKWQKS